MTSSKAYKAYYEANKERILEANKERAKQKRENPEEAQQQRQKRWTREATRKASLYKVALEELSERNPDKDWSMLFKKLAESSLLSDLTPSIMTFLMRIHCEAMTASIVDGTKSDP